MRCLCVKPAAPDIKSLCVFFFLPVQPAGEEAAEVQAEVETGAAQVALVVAKRQAPELTADCTIYRYGSLSTSLDVVRE